MTECERIASWAAALRLEDLPESVLERARLQADAVHAAARAGEEAAAPIAAVAPRGPLGEVWSGAAASIAHDWDDYLYMGHTGHSAVWAAGAFAADPDRALVAQVAANEVAGRLGAALFLGPHNGQFWSAIHCAGGAVAAGVASGLSAERLAHALAIALYQPPFGLWPGFMEAPTKLLTAAEPALQGARAVLLAAEGLDGALDVIEHPRGLLRYFSYVPRPAMLGALGQTWLTDTLAFKLYPGCAYVQTAVDAALRLDVDVDDIAAIDVDAGLLTVAMDALNPKPSLTAVGVNFSTPLSIAVALHAGRLTPAELAPEWLEENGSRLRELTSRIRVRHDWELSLRTARGTLEGGASLRDVPRSALLRLAGHLRESTGGASFDLAGLLRDRRLRARLGKLAIDAGRPGPRGMAALDTERLRMTFPARLRVKLRSGAVRDVEGEEHGVCGASLEAQRQIVARREGIAAPA